MARLARTTLVGYPHHLVQRGYHDRTVFEFDADYRRYLDWLREYTERFAVDIWAYCLMPNHVHVICVPKAEGALARAFNSLHMRYAQYFNGKRHAHGPVWRPRFMSCILDDATVHEEVRFIENNPLRQGLAERAEDYAWSSASNHLSGKYNPNIFGNNCPIGDTFDWRAYLEEIGDEAMIYRVRARLKIGRPAGNLEFIRKIEFLTGRHLDAKPRGRPKKKQ
jgi:putative transposase